MGSLWNRSGTIERYGDDIRAAGAKAYFFQGGTTSPLTVFQDAGESAAHPSPVVADANGRWPDIFVPYTTAYDVRVTSSFGSQLTFTLRIPNPNPVDTTVIIPPENQVQTGMIHAEFVNAPKSGYIRLNGLTIGNGASSATERANNDTSALFTYLWNNILDSICPVTPGGRGSSAISDFNANKSLGLPDMRGTILQGLDDMGGPVAGRFTGLTFNTGSGTTTGSSIGVNAVTLSSTQMPAHFHTGTTAVEAAHTHAVSIVGNTGGISNGHTHSFSGLTAGQSVDHTHTALALVSGGIGGTAGGTGLLGASTIITTSGASNDHAHNFSGTTSDVSAIHTHPINISTTSAAGSAHSHTFTTSTEGGVTPINNIPLARLVTWFMKL